MKKPLLLSMFFSLITLTLFSQELTVKSGDNGLYLEHTVAAKEGLYSIGRLYNINPKTVAAYNRIDLNGGLNIGQQIRIPLNDTNFTQKTAKGFPVYYEPGTGEGLMKVSNANRKVSLANLRTWNKLSGDNIKAGQKLVVGYLVSKDFNPAVLAKAPVIVTPAEATAPQQEITTSKTGTTQPEQVSEVPKKGTAQTEQVSEVPKKGTTKTEDVGQVTNKGTSRTEQVSEVPKKETEAVKPVVPQVETSRPNVPTQETPARDASGNDEPIKLSAEDGFFKTFFDQQIRTSPISKNTPVTAGIFKTSSGWQDSKYYLLMDGVATGTIVRIINPDNNRAVYAKVLGEMNGIRQNQGLGIRISNAAASALGIREQEKFVVRVNY